VTGTDRGNAGRLAEEDAARLGASVVMLAPSGGGTGPPRGGAGPLAIVVGRQRWSGDGRVADEEAVSGSRARRRRAVGR
jgi:hypothetical protein